jgi:hypothetical protein
MVARPFVVPVMRYCSPYWAGKVLDFVTVSWFPTQFMRDVRELRRIVETVDNVNRTVYAEKKAAVKVNKLDSVDDVRGDGDLMPSTSMMDIMRKFHRQLRHPYSSTHSKGQLHDVQRGTAHRC